MTKKELRSKYKVIRSEITQRSDKSVAIAVKLLDNSLFLDSTDIFLYFSVGTEVSTLKIFEAAVMSDRKVAFPKCADSDGNMEFYYVSSINELKEGMYGIFEPDTSVAQKAIPSADSIIIVPALAFDVRGYRLGYGKGYYDRFLSKHPCKSIGIAFDECVCSELPYDVYDKKINCLITDRSVYYFD